MSAIPGLLKGLVLEGIVSRRRDWPRVNVPGFVFIWLAAVTGVVGLIFLLCAEYFYFRETADPALAALWVAITAFFLCGGCALAGIDMLRKKGAVLQNTAPMPDIAKTAGVLIETLAADLEEPVRQNPKTALILAALAGFVAGEKLH